MKTLTNRDRKRNIKFNEKRNYVFDKFEKEYANLCLHEKACVKHTDKCGKLLIHLKDFANECDKPNWDSHFDDRFLLIDSRRGERYMDFANQCDFDQNPALAFMGKARLYELLAFAGKLNLSTYLKEWGINCDVNIEDDGAIERLKCCIQDFLFSFNATIAQAFEAKRKFLYDYPANEKKTKKEKRKEVVMNFTKSALSFVKNIDLVLDEKKAVTIEGNNLLQTVRGVQKKLRTLRKHMKSLRKGSVE